MSKETIFEALRRGGFAFWKYNEQTRTTFYENRFTGVIVAVRDQDSRMEVIAA